MLHAKLKNRTCQGLYRQGQGQGLTSLSRKRYKIGHGYYGRLAGSHRLPVERSVSVPMTLIEAGHERSRFLADLRNCARMHVWPTLTKFCTVTQVRSMFLRGSATTSSEGAGAPASPGSWDPYLGPYGLTLSHQFWYGNTCGTECVSRGQPRPHPKWACPQRHHLRPSGLAQSDQIRHGNACGGQAWLWWVSHTNQIRGYDVPKIYGISYMHAHSMRSSNQTLHKIKLDVTESAKPPPSSNFWPQGCWRCDPFVVVANLLVINQSQPLY